MLAPIVALETFADRVRGADVFLLIDSEAVEGALIKGYSSREDLCIDRVSTDANPADWPSRDKLEIGEAAGWSTFKPIWPNELFC